jgi:hypothetical protein
VLSRILFEIQHRLHRFQKPLDNLSRAAQGVLVSVLVGVLVGVTTLTAFNILPLSASEKDIKCHNAMAAASKFKNFPTKHAMQILSQARKTLRHSTRL